MDRGYVHGVKISRAISEHCWLTDRELHRRVADFLMLEADGGDDPAEVVRGAIEMAIQDREEQEVLVRAREALRDCDDQMKKLRGRRTRLATQLGGG